MRGLALAFALVAVLGVAAVITYVAMVIAVHVSNLDPPEGDTGWWVIIAGYLGAAAAPVFGALALAFWPRKPKSPR